MTSQKAQSFDNFQCNFNRAFRNTNLQNSLRDLYSSRKDTLSNNAPELEKLTQIAGNRGFSHSKRIEKITNWVNWLGNNGYALNNSEKQYVGELLDVSYNHLRETSEKADGHVKLTRKISGRAQVLKNINSLRSGLENNNYKGFLERADKIKEEADARSSSLVQTSETAESQHIQIQKHQSHQDAQDQISTNYLSSGRSKMAGTWKFPSFPSWNNIKNSVLCAAAGVIIAAGGVVGGYVIGENKGVKSQQPTITAFKKSNLGLMSKLTESDEKNQRMMDNFEDELFEKNWDLYESKINLKAANKTIEANGRPDAEVRAEAVENTTQILKTQYGGIIEEKNQEAENQVDALVRNYETKLGVAGRPDAKVRAEAVEQTTQRLKSDYEPQIKKLNQQVTVSTRKLNDERNDRISAEFIAGAACGQQEKLRQENEGLKIDSENSVILYGDLQDSYWDLDKKSKDEIATLNGQLEGITKVADGYINGDFCEEFGKGVGVEDSGLVSFVDANDANVAEANTSTIPNSLAEARMAMLGFPNPNINTPAEPVKTTWRSPALQCLCEEIYEEMDFTEQQYLKDGFLAHAGRLGKKAKRLGKEGDGLGSLATRFGQLTAIANDIIEIPVGIITSAGGAIWGTGSQILGNKNDSFVKGWKGGSNFGKFVVDGWPGGISKNTTDTYLATLQPKKAIAVSYCMEDSKLGGHVKLADIAASNFFSFKWLFNLFKGKGGSHNPSGGLIRTGGVEGSAGRGGGMVK